MQRRPRYNNMNLYNQNIYPFQYMNTEQTKETNTCQKEQTKDVQTQTMNCYNTTYNECKPIYTTTKNIVDQYHITKQPYICNYHTEVVHHYITENEFIPTYTKSDVYDPKVCNR